MNIYPLVSIVLCTYNGEKYLEEQLDSLVKQTYPNIEIIVVDDCSSDATIEILNEYEKRYNFFKVQTNSHNLGWNKNFERCINLCKGEFIAISDQDDIWMLNKVSVMLENIKDNLLIYSRSEMIDSKGNPLHKDSIGKKGIPYSGSDPRVIVIYNLTWGHNIFFHRKLLSLAFPLSQGIDYDRQLGVAALNYGHLQFLNQTLVYHREHENNATLISKEKEGLQTLKGRLEAILTLKNLRNEYFFKHFLDLVNQANHSKSGKIKLFLFFFKNRNLLFYTSKKSIFSKMNKARKMIG